MQRARFHIEALLFAEIELQWTGSLLICWLCERVFDLLAPVHWRNQNQQCPSRYNQAKLSSRLVALIICTTLVTPIAMIIPLASHRLLHMVQYQVHELIVTFQRSNHYHRQSPNKSIHYRHNIPSRPPLNFT